MGVRVSFCCCCPSQYEVKTETLKELANENCKTALSSIEVLKKLYSCKERLIELLNTDYPCIYSNSWYTICLDESKTGHILKICLNIDKPSANFKSFLDKSPRTSWDTLVENCNTLEENSDYSIVYMKYKSQVSYSAKDLVIAKKSENHENGILVYYTSVPIKKSTENVGRIEIYEGGYTLQGSDNTVVNLVVHFKIGASSLTKLIERLCEKMVPGIINSLINLIWSF